MRGSLSSITPGVATALPLPPPGLSFRDEFKVKSSLNMKHIYSKVGSIYFNVFKDIKETMAIPMHGKSRRGALV